MEIAELKTLLKGYGRNEIKFGPHSELRAIERDVNTEEVIDNLTKPDRLVDFEEQQAKNSQERKFRLYFKMSNSSFLVIIAVLKPNHHIEVLTVFNRWRKLHRTIKEQQKRLLGRY